MFEIDHNVKGLTLDKKKIIMYNKMSLIRILRRAWVNVTAHLAGGNYLWNARLRMNTARFISLKT